MLKKFRQSLITRLIIYFVIAALLIMTLFGFKIAIGLKEHFKQEVLPNIAQYLTYITEDIGAPPDFDKAKQLSENLHFEMRIEGPGISWQSHQQLPGIAQLRLKPGPEPYQQFRISHHEDNNYVLLSVDGIDYLYVVGRLFNKHDESKNGIGLFAILILVVLFFLIRASLKPIQTISAGIKDIAEGNLDSPITVKQSTEFKKLAEGINDMASQISAMLRGKQELLLAISHELRSPITRAKVNLELLTDNPIRQNLIEDMNEMELLISQILESERLNHRHAELNKSEFSLDQFIEELIQQYFSQCEIQTEIQPLTIHADKMRLGLLIKNLLDNAIKYSPIDGPSPLIRIYAKQDKIVIEVKDTGIGMAPEQLAQITQAFYRVDQARQRKTGGYGLGLYLSQLIVNAHRGEMTFESEPNRGTLVSVELPAS